MLIRRSEATHGNILPEAFNVLSAVPDHLTFHEEHGMRHPKSAYGTSIRLISSQWMKTIDELDRLRHEYNWEGKDERIGAVVDSYVGLLSRLNEHFDACFAALRCLCPASMAKATPFDTQFLDKAKPSGWKQFREATRSYREDRVGLIVNTLKHRQGELCAIYFKSSVEFRPGYYLRDVLPGGALGPSAALHSGGNSAFSFARDMLMHLWWLYRIGELLSTAVRSLIRALHGHVLAETPQGPGATQWVDLVRACSTVRPEFFPDESRMPYPRVLLQPSPLVATLEFPTTARGIGPGPNWQIKTFMTVDGAHRTNKMPYMGHLP